MMMAGPAPPTQPVSLEEAAERGMDVVGLTSAGHLSVSTAAERAAGAASAVGAADFGAFAEDSKSVATEGSDHLSQGNWDSDSDGGEDEARAAGAAAGGVDAMDVISSTGWRKGSVGEARAAARGRHGEDRRVDTGKAGSTPKGVRYFRRKDPATELSVDPLEEEEEAWQRRAMADGRSYYLHAQSGLKRWYEPKDEKQFAVGDVVEINYKDRGVWYPSTVRVVDFIGKGQVEYDYGVEYDDTPGKVFGQYEHKIRPPRK
jgi:hypothetical protein